MMTLVLEHLDRLRADLDRIDPVRDLDAADRVADIAAALRQAIARPASRDDGSAVARTGYETAA